jgi:hypothetical protein
LPEFQKGQVGLIKEMTLTEFQIYLYYVLESDEVTLVGAYGPGGKMMISSCSDSDTIMSIMVDVVQTEIPLEKKLIVKSWEYLFAEDYRNSIIYAAIVLELAISKKLKMEFNSKSVASIGNIDKFIDNVSNRLLCTVILGLLKIENEQLRTNIAKIFDIRNGLIHGKRKIIREKEAKDALYHTEEFLKLINNHNE